MGSKSWRGIPFSSMVVYAISVYDTGTLGPRPKSKRRDSEHRIWHNRPRQRLCLPEKPMNKSLKETVARLLSRVQTPAQYLGGELHSVVKDHRQVRGKLCLAFPDAYTLGMSHHGLQVLYTIMNNDPQWACERAFTPWIDFEAELRKHRLPLYGLETFTPLKEFDLIGFSLQYEVGYTNVLNMIDLGGIPHFAKDRGVCDPLVVAGGPG